MPQMTALHIGLLAFALVVGILLGWFLNSRRTVFEKAAINAGWREQLDAERKEQRRLVDQSQGLMEQVSQLQASQKDATNRARELSMALKDAFARRDELQRQIKDIRNNLEAVLAERRRLESDVVSLTESDSHLSAELKGKNEKIFRLSRELESWQERLPPLIQRFRDRDEAAKRLESELDRANERIFELESGRAAGHTHVESLRGNPLGDELRASNDGISGGTGTFATLAGNGGIPGGGQLNMPGGDVADDLQAIKGVGPAIEKTLHQLGIFRYGQIAELNEYDINRIADRLKGFRRRIYREDWIGQARELQLRRGRDRH